MKSINAFNKRLNKLIKVVLFMLILFVSADKFGETLAKLYTTDISKETVVANSYYFSSDYLDEKDNKDIPPVYTMSGWDGKTERQFAFVIRNYENPLLYNDETQDVKYKLEYTIRIDSGDEGSNSIIPEDIITIKLQRRDETAQDESRRWIDVDLDEGEIIEGGLTRKHNDYRIVIQKKDSIDVVKNDVWVDITATTYDTQYIKEISARVILQYSQSDHFIAKQGFDIPHNEENADDVLYKTSGLSYKVCTENAQENDSSFLNTSSKVATKIICLKWDNTLLELNNYDKRLEDEGIPKDDIVYIGDTNDESANTYTKEYIEKKENIKKFINKYIFSENLQTGYIYFDSLPYSEFNFTFFRREGVNSSLKDDQGNVIKDGEGNDIKIWGSTYKELMNILQPKYEETTDENGEIVSEEQWKLNNWKVVATVLDLDKEESN